MVDSIDQDDTQNLASSKNPLEDVRKLIQSSGVFKNIVGSIDPIVAGNIESLGSILLQAAEQGNVRIIKIFLEETSLINYKNPKTGQTVLHLSAAYEGKKVMDVLLESEQVDYLIRDNQGRFASELAFTIADDVVTCERLRIKEREQADTLGIKLTRRPTKG